MKETNLLERIHIAETNEKYERKKRKETEKKCKEILKENEFLKKNLDSF